MVVDVAQVGLQSLPLGLGAEVAAVHEETALWQMKIEVSISHLA